MITPPEIRGFLAPSQSLNQAVSELDEQQHETDARNADAARNISTVIPSSPTVPVQTQLSFIFGEEIALAREEEGKVDCFGYRRLDPTRPDTEFFSVGAETMIISLWSGHYEKKADIQKEVYHDGFDLEFKPWHGAGSDLPGRTFTGYAEISTNVDLTITEEDLWGREAGEDDKEENVFVGPNDTLYIKNTSTRHPLYPTRSILFPPGTIPRVGRFPLVATMARLFSNTQYRDVHKAMSGERYRLLIAGEVEARVRRLIKSVQDQSTLAEFDEYELKSADNARLAALGTAGK